MKNNVSDYFNNFVMKVIKNKEHLEVFLKASSMDDDMKAALLDMWEDNHKEEVSKNVKVLEGSVVTEDSSETEASSAPLKTKRKRSTNQE